jgi:hypothetical protein
MDRQNRSMRGGEENQRKRLAMCADVLSKWFLKWSEVFPTHEVTRMQIATYAEALDDLLPEELEIACRQATRTAEQFPKPGHIRKALEGTTPIDDTIYLGVPQISYPEPTPEEREEQRKAREEYAEKLREVVEPAGPRFKIPQSQLSIEQQKEELKKRGYLQ